MLNKTFLDVLDHEGVVTIISDGGDGFHVVNTWNSYMQVDDDTLYIPAAGMHSVEADVAKNPELYLTAGSREVEGTVGPGTGFHVKGLAKFLTEGSKFDEMKEKFPFLSRVLQIDVTSVEQKI